MLSESVTAWTAEVAEIEAWMERAQIGDRFVYARAPMLPQGPTKAAVQALHDDGEVLLFQRRVGGAPEYVMQRRSSAARPQVRLQRPAVDPPSEPVPLATLGREAEALYQLLDRLARGRVVCPSNHRLAALAGLRDRNQAAYQLIRLKDAGLIKISALYGAHPGRDLRVITMIGKGRATARPQGVR
jgi:hypothetical protein